MRTGEYWLLYITGGKVLKNKTLKLLWTYVQMALPGIVVALFAIPFGILTGLGAKSMTNLTLLLIGQNISFTIVSRARQMSGLKLHTVAALGSNGFYIFVFTTMVAHYNSLPMKMWYILCTTVGSVSAHYVSMHHIEKSKALQKGAMISRSDLDNAIADALSSASEHTRLEIQLLKAELNEGRAIGVPLSNVS